MSKYDKVKESIQRCLDRELEYYNDAVLLDVDVLKRIHYRCIERLSKDLANIEKLMLDELK